MQSSFTRLVNSEALRNPQTRKVADAVSSAEVESFSHQFISLKCLALEQNVSVQKMAHDLRLLEIKSIFLRHGVRTQIFRRDQLPRNLVTR